MGLEADERRMAAHGRLKVNSRKLLLYGSLALVPIVLFVLMMLLARR